MARSPEYRSTTEKELLGRLVSERVAWTEAVILLIVSQEKWYSCERKSPSWLVLDQ